MIEWILGFGTGAIAMGLNLIALRQSNRLWAAVSFLLLVGLTYGVSRQEILEPLGYAFGLGLTPFAYCWFRRRQSMYF